MSITRNTALWATRGAIATGAAVMLAACGSSNNAGGTNAGGETGGSQASGAGIGQGGPGGGQGRPGANGQIADITGNTLQVQNQQSGQIAVTWSDKTTFTQEVSTTKSAVKVGSCVVASAPRDTSSTGTASTPDLTSPIAAASVRITEPASDGSCAGGFGGSQGRPGGLPSGVPTDIPSDFQGSAPGGQGDPGGRRGGFANTAFGKVTAVTATGFTVESSLGGQSSSRQVSVSGTTTYSTTAAASASALTVGKCVQANGTADNTGAVAATRIAVSSPVGGSCTSGFGPRG